MHMPFLGSTHVEDVAWYVPFLGSTHVEDVACMCFSLKAHILKMWHGMYVPLLESTHVEDVAWHVPFLGSTHVEDVAWCLSLEADNGRCGMA